MRKWIAFPLKQGEHSSQAHADVPESAIYEREVGRNGFFGPASHIHHKHPPTGWIEWEGELRPRAYDLLDLTDDVVAKDCPFSAPVLLHNTHCQYRFWQCNQPMKALARNSDGDDLLFIHEGEGDFFCDYGQMSFSQGDYIVIPRGTQWRIANSSPVQVLMIEATNDSYQLPDKGMLGGHAIFDPAVLTTPQINQAFIAQQDDTDWQVRVKRHNTISVITYPFNPLDAQGWHGDLCVVKLNWRDIRPIMSHRYHLPPSAHTTFVAARFVVCTFVPRPIESDPGALKVPFYHSNDDYDEVLFYHAGDFFSRDNIDAGMVTFHPAGFPHGPHPKAFAAGRANAKKQTDEVAVMLDTRDALIATEFAQNVEQHNYVDSWKAN